MSQCDLQTLPNYAFQPLNATLYNALVSRFGRVVVANEGCAWVATAYQSGLNAKRIQYDVTSAGEYYRLCCPFCRENRFRLWINHMYGVPTQQGWPATWLAVCYNEQCTQDPGRRKQLEDMIFGFRNAAARRKPLYIAQGREDTGVLGPVQLPGQQIPFSQLPLDHPAAIYLQSRGFNPLMLEHYYGILYCVQADDANRPAVNRIIVPIRMDGALVGWQGRWPADLDWKASGVRKYFNLKNMHKRLMLYNYDVAKAWPFVVVVEGVTSAWRIGPPAVAVLGKTLSPRQQMLLQHDWAGKPIILILDPDARDEMEGILASLVRTGKQPIIPIYLPAGFDPANYNHEVIVRMIQVRAAECGVTLPDW